MTQPVSIGDDGRNANPPEGEGPALTWLKTWAEGLAASVRANAEAAVLQAEQARWLATPNPVPLTASGVVPASGTLYLDLGAPQLGRRWLTRLITAASAGASGAGVLSGITEVAPANPAPGTSYTYTLPSAASINSLTFTYTASAVAGTRYAVVQVTDTSGTVVYQVPANSGTVASTSVEPFLSNNSLYDLTAQFGSYAPITAQVFPAGYHVVITVSGGLPAGDQISGIVMMLDPAASGTIAGTADWYIGQVPAGGLIAPPSGWRWRLTGLPAAETFSNEQLPVLPSDHLYCAIAGGTAGLPMVACAIVLDYPTAYARAITTT